MIKTKSNSYRFSMIFVICVCAAIAIAMLVCSCGFVHDSMQKQKKFMVYGIDRASFSNATAYRALAFDTKRDTIYAINDVAILNKNNVFSRIDVLDFNGNPIDVSITGFRGKESTQNQNIVDATFERASDIKIHGDKLFVSSMSTCRVDVYQLPARNSSFIMSLGKGGTYSNNSRDNNMGLYHPKALAVTDNFIFVTEYRNTIGVYTTDVLTSSNHLKAQKFCYLSWWPTDQSARNRQQYIEYLNVIDGKLYATSDGLNEVYVYDITKLSSGATVQPVKIYTKATGASKMHGISQSDDIVFVSHGSKDGDASIKVYDLEEFTSSILNDRKLPNALVSFSNVFGQSMNTPKNIYFYANNLYFNNISYPKANDNTQVNNTSKVFKVKWSAYEIKEK